MLHTPLRPFISHLSSLILITSPAFYLLLLLLAAYLLRHKQRTKNALLATAVAFTLFFTCRPIYNLVSTMWSKGCTSEIKSGKVYHYGIVLGGFGSWDEERTRPEFGPCVDRLLEGVQLYRKGSIQKLVIAGDASNRIYDNPEKQNGNPQAMRAYIQRFGVSPADLILENKALTTRENARYLLALIGDSLKKERPLVITSAEHLRRALMTFEQEGIPVDGYATDCIVKNKNKSDLMPSLSVMTDWQHLLHEFIGYLYYSI